VKEKAKRFFLKKEAKTFFDSGLVQFQRRQPRVIKSFLVTLFQKK
jgi:hypothetical protein